jgi:hypothetical protein
MRPTYSFLAPVLLSYLISLASTTCTRDKLSQTLDLFFLNAITHDPLPLSPTAKTSSNGYMQTSINNTAFSNTTWLESPEFKVQVLDVTACQAARYTVAREKSVAGVESPALVSLRVALADNDGLIEELEITNVVKGEHILFYPDKFELRTPPLYNSSQAFPPGASLAKTKVLTRKEIAELADSYVVGIQTGNKSLVKIGPYCPRTANGQRINDHCEEGDQGLATFHWQVENRRWIADAEKGVAFGSYIVQGTLGADDNTWDIVNEYVAVKDGAIREIRAVMVHEPKGIKAVWPEDSTRSYRGQ